jgi:hypothetical protein
MPAKILKFPGEKGGVKSRSKSRQLSPIDHRLREILDEHGNPRNRQWLDKKAGISYSCLTSYCNGRLPDNLKNIYLRRVMTILEIDENYLLGLPRKGSV